MIKIKNINKSKGYTLDYLLRTTIDEYVSNGYRVASVVPVKYELKGASSGVGIRGSYDGMDDRGSIELPVCEIELSSVMIVFEYEDHKETEIPELVVEDTVAIHNKTEKKSQKDVKPKTKVNKNQSNGDKKQTWNKVHELEYTRLMAYFNCSREKAVEHHKNGYRLSKKGELINIIERSQKVLAEHKLKKMHRDQE